MFNLNENYEVGRRILKCDYFRYSPEETSTTNTLNGQIYINMPRENSVISLLNSFLDLNFEVLKRTDKSKYSNGIETTLLNLCPIALFSNFKLTTSSGKQLEDLSQAHLVSLTYKLMTSSKGSDDLSIGFDRSPGRRRDGLTITKNVQVKYHLRILIKAVFGFVKSKEKASYDLSSKLTLTRNKDDVVIDKAAGSADARNQIDHIHWPVPHYTPSFQQENILMNQIVNKIPTELRYFERSVFMKKMNIQNLWKFELGSQESMNVPVRIAIGF